MATATRRRKTSEDITRPGTARDVGARLGQTDEDLHAGPRDSPLPFLSARDIVQCGYVCRTWAYDEGTRPRLHRLWGRSARPPQSRTRLRPRAERDLVSIRVGTRVAELGYPV